MKIKVIDDYLPEQIAELMHNYMLKLPHRYKEYSADGSSGHLSYDFEILKMEDASQADRKYEKLFLSNLLMRNMLHEIMEFTETPENEIYLERFHTNMQFPGMGGDGYHVDGTHCTSLLMFGDISPESGFKYKDHDNVEHVIVYKHNRLILFAEPHMPHVGIPPKNMDNGPRITVALKTYKYT